MRYIICTYVGITIIIALRHFVHRRLAC
jgi:hypothetical protein